VLAEAKFKNDIKLGLFAEVFSSPFASDVISLFLASDEGGSAVVTQMNRLSSSKTIWLELEPGSYTFQVVCVL
jgi:hypothetical protein